MVDISVDALFSAKETISNSLNEIREASDDVAQSIVGTNSAADSLGDEANNLIADMAGANRALESVEGSLDDVSGESQEAIANLSALQGAMLTTNTTARDMGRRLRSIDAGPLINSDRFRRNLAESFDISQGEVSQRLGLFQGTGRGDTLEDLAGEFQQVEGVDRRTALSGITQTALSLPGTRALEDQFDGIDDSAEEADDSTSRFKRALNALTRASIESGTSLGFLSLAMNGSEESADDASDEVKDLSRSLRSLRPAVRSLSANIGPFNVGLQNIATTIPTMIAVLVPLIAVLSSLLTVIVGVVGALGSFAAVGAVQTVNELEESFAGIEDTMGAVEAIAKGLKEALWEALEPLQNVEFAGMGGMEFFMRLMQNFVLFVRNISEALAMLLSMDEVESFFFRIESALLTANGAGEDATSMMEALRTATEEFLPPLTDFIVWLIEGTPTFLIFASTISDDLLPAIRNFVTSLIELSRTLSIIGTAVLSTLLPALAFLIDRFNDLLLFVIALDDVLGPLSEGLTVFLVTSITLTAVLLKLAVAIDGVVKAWMTLSAAATSSIAPLATFAIGIAAIVAGLVIIERETGKVSDAFSVLSGYVNTISSLLSGLNNTLESAGVNTEKLSSLMMIGIGVISTFVGVMLAVNSVLSVYSIVAGTASAFNLGMLVPSFLASASAAGVLGAVLYATGIGALLALAGAVIYAALHMNQMVDIINDIIDSFTDLGAMGLALVAIFPPIIGLIGLLITVKEAIKLIMNPNQTVDNWWDSIIEGIQGLMRWIRNLVKEAKDSINFLDPTTGRTLGIRRPSPERAIGSRGREVIPGTNQPSTSNNQTNVTVNVENRGREMTAKEANEIGNMISNTVNKNENRESGG